ncbi:hypothetical protein GOP47_0017983 [Adiantum capillus-veneris]|uniref:Nucleolar protein 12 n=1 Tax=Adiantum capillus-veneris TaxID=13818 RepID=A0A9D4UGP0_ADICA|nr:hypothetical protein GOP47_0017983 [Adiantum capillus-veneris]
MDEEENEQEAGGGGAVVGRHLSKRARKNKGLVIVFDADARKEFVTGFQKRKKKRRKLAEQQKQLKDRQKRLQERRERRLAMAEALGQSESKDAAEEDMRSPDSNESDQGCKGNGTVMYEDKDATTVVNTYSIDMDAGLAESKQLRPHKAANALSIRRSTQKKRKCFENMGERHSKQRKRRL